MGAIEDKGQEVELVEQRRCYTEEVASLQEIALALTSASDLDGILDVVLKQVKRVLGCDLCGISLATADGSALQFRAVAGKGAERLLGFDFSIEQGINAWIYREGKPVLANNAARDPRRLRIEGRTDMIQAAVGAPLIADGQPLGTIYAAGEKPGVFTEAHLDFLILTATQVATAVQRAWLLEQARRRVEEMESIYHIGAMLASSLDIDQILQVIYEQAGRIMDTSAFLVALYDKEREELCFRLFYDQGERLEPFTTPLSETEGLVDHVVRTGEPFLIRHMAEEQTSLPISPVVIGQLPQSWLGVPIIFADEVLGVISAQSYEAYAFNNRQLQLLSAIANQAGVGLQNAGLFARLQRARQATADERDKLVHLHRLVASIQRTDGILPKLQVIADGIHDLGWRRVAVSLRDAELNVVELACAGFEPDDEAALRASLPPGSEWQARFGERMKRFRIGSCYYLPWSDPWVREHVQSARMSGTGSELEAAAGAPEDDSWHPLDLLYVPLLGRNERIVGVIGLDAPLNRRRPTIESLQIIELFAQEAALAIENAKLVADLKLVNTDLREMVDAQAHLLNTIEEMITALDLEGLEALHLLARREESRA